LARIYAFELEYTEEESASIHRICAAEKDILTKHGDLHQLWNKMIIFYVEMGAFYAV
jgi:hypothetical protein